MDDPIYDIELEDCPICRGAGLIQDEQGWSVSVACMDCGAETAHAFCAEGKRFWGIDKGRERGYTCCHQKAMTEKKLCFRGQREGRPG